MPITPAQNINELISTLETLIRQSQDNNDRIGYFAALYHKVTLRVKEGIQNNEFEDGHRMEQLDVTFANRYLAAVSQWKSQQTPSGPWLVALQGTQKSSLLVLQQLLLGISAHINFDLGIAAVEVAGEGDIQTLRNDFNSINTIIGSLIFDVLSELNRVSPLLSLFGLHATNDSILIQFSIGNARDGAWGFAEELHSKQGAAVDACIAARDATIKKLALSLANPTGLLGFTRWIIHLFEWKQPAKIINVLYQSKKKYISF